MSQERESQGSDMEAEPITELRNKCEELWEQLQKVHVDVCKTRDITTVTEDDAQMKIYKAKERRMRAEIAVIEQKEPQVLPKDKDAQIAMLKEELADNVSQLEVTLSVVQTVQKKMEDDIKREGELEKQHRAINEVLREKVEQTSTEVTITEKRYYQELKEKEKKAKEHQMKLMKLMADFIHEHFPLPTETDVNQARRKPNTRMQSDASLSRATWEELLPLEAILEMLMNKCLDTPHDAYVTVDERFWQPYVQVLLRCNIALRHPEDDHRIKLVPFHL